MVTKTKRILNYCIAAFIIALLGLAIAKVFWQAYSHYNPSSTRTSQEQIISDSVSASPTDYAKTITNESLFGTAKVAKKVKNLVVADIPESSLNVTIKGILALADEAASVAILSVEGANEKIFKLGDQLSRRNTIAKITSTGIMVDNNGRLEMIRLPRAQLNSNAEDLGSSQLSSPIGLSALRKEVMGNPLELEQYINFAPHTSNNEFVGYRVSAGKRSELFVRLGLKTNDIVTSIDNVPIAKLAGRMDILTNLSVAKTLSLGIVRGGEKQQLKVDFSQ
jgi:general secretion pathway protein C